MSVIDISKTNKQEPLQNIVEYSTCVSTSTNEKIQKIEDLRLHVQGINLQQYRAAVCGTSELAFLCKFCTELIPDREVDTFTSYIDELTESDEHVRESASVFFDSDLQPVLLPGERMMGEADMVLKFTPFSDGKQGMSGKLCVTNFRLSFVTADRSSYEHLPGHRRRNKLIDETDIPLTSIDTIYHVTSNGRRKKLPQGHHTSSTTKLLEIHCKDLRIHTFSFKFTPSQQNKQFVNVAIHYAYPTKQNLLFAYEYVRNKPNVPSYDCDTPMFDCVSDWEDELKRCKCEGKWRVTELNLSFECCPSLPQYFVIPLTLYNSDLTRAAPQFTNRRVPTWSYTHINDNSLVRMAPLDADTDQPEFMKKMLYAIKDAGGQHNLPTIVDMGENCPSCREVQESYSKLRRLCMSDNKKEFAAQDAAWYSGLDDSKWLHLVSQCLTVSQYVTTYITEKRRTVVIQESSGCDFSPLVSSLAMIQLDPYFRTRIGFQSMFQREWVKMGHPFQKYLTLVTTSETEMVPILLLFLDCTWQLLQQYPSCFEFTETFLTTLWDTAQVGIFDTFLFDTDHQRGQFSVSDGRNIKQFKLPSAWLWSLQFEAEDLSFFRDPLYVITHDPELTALMSETRQLYKPGKRSQLYRRSDYARKLTANDKEESLESFSSDILQVRPSVSVLRLWMQCYLRWQAPAQILGGGSPSQYLQQCHMVEEIIHLHHKSKVEQERSNRRRPRSELIFSFAKDTPNHTTNLTDLLGSTYLTSSFPFSPGPSTKDQQMMSVPTMSVYNRNSSMDFDKYLTDEDLE